MARVVKEDGHVVSDTSITGIELMTAMTYNPASPVVVEFVDATGRVVGVREIIDVGEDGKTNFIRVFADIRNENSFLENEPK